MLQLSTTLPFLLGLGSLAAGRTLAQMPREVAVGPEGIRVETVNGSQTYPWTQIGWSAMVDAIGGQKKRLRVFDVAGKKLVEFSDDIHDLERLSKVIATHIESKGDGTAELIRGRKAKKQALFLLLSGPVFMALGIVNAWFTFESERNQQRLNDEGVRGIADVVDLRMAPNGRTPRIVYRITASSGVSAVHNVQIERRLWDALANEKKISVFYVPDDPEVSKVAFGEVEDVNAGGTGYVLAVLVTLIGAAVVVGGVFLRRGLEIHFDPDTRRISIRRFGT